MQDVKSAIKEKVEEIATRYNQELVDIELGTFRDNKTIKIIVGSQKGPTIDDLTGITREFNKFIEEENPISFEFDLEVSSPGLDRPLTTIGDFRRNIERKIKITWFSKKEDKNVHDSGYIKAVDSEKEIISLELEKGGLLELDLISVVKAKIIVEMKKKKKKKKK